MCCRVLCVVHVSIFAELLRLELSVAFSAACSANDVLFDDANTIHPAALRLLVQRPVLTKLNILSCEGLTPAVLLSCCMAALYEGQDCPHNSVDLRQCVRRWRGNE